MTAGPYLDSPPLTEEQRVIVEQPADAMVLVTAGAGAGKTHTLVRRVESLVSDEGLATGDILVLTFSRAAVRELRERLSRHGDRSRHVRVTTFDSWALEILNEVAADIEWKTRSFDERIREATKVVADENRAPEWLDELRHVVIDEVQDLVGDRRELIEVLLESYDCGFTIVGDPAQAIYGYQVTDPDERTIETNRFFDWLRSYFVDDLVELSLTRNFRASTEEACSALSFESTMRGCRTLADAERAHEELRLELATRMDFGDITVPFIRDSLCVTDITTAVLCRTNGEALLISEWLHDAGIPHQLRRAAQDRAVPAWLNELMHADQGALTLARQRFDELYPSLPAGAGRENDPERVWRLLCASTRERAGRSVDLSRLREAISAGRLPDELTAQPPHHLVISTFHRAKGLEFDRVLVVDPGQITVEKDDLSADVADRARALYVAMTRPRKELYRLEPPPGARPVENGFRLVRKDRRTGRWARFGYQYWKRSGLELLGGDIHPHHPAGSHQIDGDPVSLQEHLRSRTAPGDSVVLERIDDVHEDHEERLGPGYALTHGEHAVGVASERFRRDLYRHMQQSRSYQPRNWPRRITDLRIDNVETIAGERAAAVHAGLGELGVWLAPRPVGLGRFHYDRTEKGKD
ncbi:DNA helicase [Streptomyces carminius]|uniref:DNA 3'-5' helicase n=1 Tax=Streptomyces carminius TaxID=2665496 RepID=A0A2M8M4N2_9ACTN|nr:UvrD-helicase domain-containing protein [Streptomyces carminius]PJE99171.1 DNA helicase [Streptomyces carminius]